MCRGIKTLANFEPPATQDEIRISAVQFVRKLSGTSRPSHVNEIVFQRAVDEVTAAATRLVDSLTTAAPSRNREEEARRAQTRSRQRYGAGDSPNPAALRRELEGQPYDSCQERLRNLRSLAVRAPSWPTVVISSLNRTL